MVPSGSKVVLLENGDSRKELALPGHCERCGHCGSGAGACMALTLLLVVVAAGSQQVCAPGSTVLTPSSGALVHLLLLCCFVVPWHQSAGMCYNAICGIRNQAIAVSGKENVGSVSGRFYIFFYFLISELLLETRVVLTWLGDPPKSAVWSLHQNNSEYLEREIIAWEQH